MSTTTITIQDENRCTITYQDALTGRTVTLELFAPRKGGFVRLEAPGHPQVCQRLASTGEALTWRPADGPLCDLVRKHYRAMRRAERRALA